MAEVVDGSAVIPAGPASPPLTPPELPTAAGKDVPRSVPHPVTEYGNHYIYLRDPSVSRHLQSSNVEGKGGEDSAGADQNSNDARFCLSANGWTEEEMGYDNGQLPGTASLPPRLVMNGRRLGERGGAGRTPPAAPAPELRRHGEGPERLFPSRTASSSPYSFQDSNGATISGNTGSHRQDGVSFVPVTRGRSALLLGFSLASPLCRQAVGGQRASRLLPCISARAPARSRVYPPFLVELPGSGLVIKLLDPPASGILPPIERAWVFSLGPSMLFF